MVAPRDLPWRKLPSGTPGVLGGEASMPRHEISTSAEPARK